MLQLIQEQELIPPFFKAIKMRYAAFPEYQEQATIDITEEEDTTTFRMKSKPEVEVVIIPEILAIRPRHLGVI